MNKSEIIDDIVEDRKESRSLIKTAIITLAGLVVFLIGCVMLLFLSYRHDFSRAMEAFAEAEYTTEYEIYTDNESMNMGNINVLR